MLIKLANEKGVSLKDLKNKREYRERFAPELYWIHCRLLEMQEGFAFGVLRSASGYEIQAYSDFLKGYNEIVGPTEEARPHPMLGIRREEVHSALEKLTNAAF